MDLKLFYLHMRICHCDVRDGSMKETLYADDCALCGESLDEAMKENERWKIILE